MTMPQDGRALNDFNQLKYLSIYVFLLQIKLFYVL